MKVFYITDIFPSLSQTFVSREIAALENLGVEIGMLSLYDRSKGEPRHGVNDRLRCIPRYGSDLRCGKAGKAASHLGALASNGLRYVDAFRGTQTSGLPSMKYIFRDLPLYCQTICRFGAHHVHAHFGRMGMIVAWLASRMLGLPFSVTLHGSDVLISPYAALGRVLRAADRVVCVSEHIRGTVEENYHISPSKTALVRCGIDTQEYLPGFPLSDELRILTVARLHSVKGLHDLLAACALLRDRGVRFACSIVGDGPERNNLEASLKGFDLEGRVRLLGPMTNEQLPQLYREHSLFVLPSFSEGVPVVLMEAMACGLPVVATRVGGIPEIVEDGVNGFLVPPQAPEELAVAIETLQSKSRQERESLGVCNREKIVARFNTLTEAQKLYQLFRQTVEQGGVL